MISVDVDSNTTMSSQLPSEYKGGFIGFGTGGFYPAHFDEFKITSGKYINGWPELVKGTPITCATLYSLIVH